MLKEEKAPNLEDADEEGAETDDNNGVRKDEDTDMDADFLGVSGATVEGEGANA
jgi:hypothetical protein